MSFAGECMCEGTTLDDNAPSAQTNHHSHPKDCPIACQRWINWDLRERNQHNQSRKQN